LYFGNNNTDFFYAKTEEMAIAGPIIIVEDDIDDQELINQILQELNVENELVFFDKCEEAFDFLLSTEKQPFIIICDINLPSMNGLELKMIIDNDEELRQKSIPFIFFSTAATNEIVTRAYSRMSIQGFFQKGSNIAALKETLSQIVNYWKLSRHPS
jgi:CheY-like chemotaxis protein